MARIIKASSTDGSPPADSAVRNLADIAAEARSIVLDARRDAARIVAEARAEADAVCDAAAKKGYAEGLARGRNDGYADGQRQGAEEAAKRFSAEAADLIELARKITEELASARAELLHQARCEMLDFAMELAEKIVGRVATTEISAARENLRKVLERADCAQGLTVKVNPSQLERLRGTFAELVDALGCTGEVRLVPDGRISPGGAKLVASEGEIDATIQTQLANVAEAVLGQPSGKRGPGRYEPVTSARSIVLLSRPPSSEAGGPPSGVRRAERGSRGAGERRPPSEQEE